MKKLVLLVAVMVFSGWMYAQIEPLRLKTSVPLPDIKGDFDHFAADLSGGRLFLAAEERKSVEVFDLKTGKHIKSISGFDTPHAIVYSPEKDTLLVTDSGPEDGIDGYIRVVSLKDSKIVGSIKVLAAADSAGFDPETHLMYADTGGLEAKMNHTVIAVIDTLSAKKVNEIGVDSGRVEAITFERNGTRMFVNMRTKGQVGVFDKKSSKLLKTWQTPDATENVPMALDEKNHRLFVVTRKPAKLVVFNTETGEAVASLPTVGRADDMAFDPTSRRLYVSGGDGFIGVYAQADPDHYSEIAHVPSGPKANVSIYVPELKQLYVAASAEGTIPAKLLVYSVK
jgi:DNA-binding beta-propeller fold protein YncE